jgi:tRNA modification GTPase
LELDFSEEDVAFANRDELLDLIKELRETLSRIMASFEQGNVMKNGVPVVILGPPNAGKSTLLNRILNEERAIVSEIPGTTRDAVEDSINIKGILFRFIDTAGIRETGDVVENIGIQRAMDRAGSAKLIILLSDASQSDRTSFEKMTAGLEVKEGQAVLHVINKVDKLGVEEAEKLEKVMDKASTFLISAKEGHGVDALLEGLVGMALPDQSEGEGIIVSNLRHLEALKACDKMLETTVQGINENRSTELIAMDVRQALHHLGLITGEVSTDDLLSNIFSRCCIGN